MNDSVFLLLTATVLTLLMLALGARFAVVILRRRRHRVSTRKPDLLIDVLEQQTRRERQAEAQRLETARALEALDALHRTVMQHLPLGILVLDSRGTIRFANPWLLNFFGSDDVLEQPLETLSRALADCLTTMQTEAELELAVRGSNRVLRVSRTEMEGQTLVTLRDETRLKKLEEQVRVKRDLELMGELAGGVTHEVKNTLATIRGLIQLLPHSEVSELEPKLLAEVDRLNRFVRRLTASSKAGRPEQEILNAKTWLEHQMTRWCQLDHGDEVALEDVDVSVTIRADSAMLTVVLENLVRNGLDACRETNPASPWVTVSVESDPDAVRIIVSDRGPGFADHVRDRLFVPFVTAKQDGTGLGLFQCRKIMLEHGGSLTVDPEPPTRITCSLPTEDQSRF